jgi:hypothetical protein
MFCQYIGKVYGSKGFVSAEKTTGKIIFQVQFPTETQYSTFTCYFNMEKSFHREETVK